MDGQATLWKAADLCLKLPMEEMDD